MHKYKITFSEQNNHQSFKRTLVQGSCVFNCKPKKLKRTNPQNDPEHSPKSKKNNTISERKPELFVEFSRK